MQNSILGDAGKVSTIQPREKTGTGTNFVKPPPGPYAPSIASPDRSTADATGFKARHRHGEETDYIHLGAGGPQLGRFDESGVFTWTHSDHLGSASLGVTAAGAEAWRESYTPFGEPILDPAANRDEAGFTGHIRDHATGLTYAQARYYNPVTARFLSPDPVGFAEMEGDWRYFQRYAYTANDPVNATDPDGEARVLLRAVLWGLKRSREMQRQYREERRNSAAPPPSGDIVFDNDEHGGEVPALPEGPVGEGPRPGGGRINSGPLAPEHGGTGDAEKDFEILTGGTGAPSEDAGRPSGTRQGDNGIQIRPGKPAAEGRPATGPRIDIPSNEDKPRETLHYPPE